MKNITLSSLRFCYFVVKRFNSDGCLNHAAALAYTTLLSLVPLLAVVFSVLSAFPVVNTISTQIQNFIFSNFVPASGQVVQSYLQQFVTQATHLSLIGSAFLIVTAVLLLFNVEQTFNHIWRVKRARQITTAILLYWALLTLLPLLFGVGFAVSSYILALPVVSSTTQWLGVGKWLALLPFLSSWLAFTLLYVAVPNCKVPFYIGLIGGMVAAVLFELVKLGFTFYVANFNTYQLLYGALSAIPFFLVWLYLIWLVILFGAEVSHVLMIHRQEKIVQDE